ncbi:BZIP domain-containing protein [Aphelenchoides bicaudatus]|nr:BZIP domain-containing protein [Aphelenchoides bicaudatus]
MMEPQNTLETSNMLTWFLSYCLDMPSTAEIIQKCLNVNPFDLKFREANMQISGQTPEQGAESRVGAQLGLPVTPSGITLKLPSSLNQSPSVFANVLSAAEIEGKLRENLDFSRKFQQLREANLVKQEGNRTPCTADVLNAVLDMNMNQAITIPSTSSLVAGLTAATTNSNLAANSTIVSSSSAVAPTTITAAVLASAANEQSDLSRNLGFAAFQAPVNPEINPISQANLAASTAAALLQQTTIANMISSQSSLNPATLNANQSMPNLHAGFQATNNNSAPASNALAAPRASPGLANHSPRSTSHLMELHKNSVVDAHRAASVDPWEVSSEVKPLINKALPPYSMYESAHGRLELKTDLFGGSLNAPASSADSSSSSQPNSHLGATENSKPHRKYARYHNPNHDGQFTSGRGGRGRRSLTSEMPPDERRNTILERNKAAAVRYRKRKKEEHDEMIGRVHGLEQDKVFLQTQNVVYKKEIDRLTELLKARDARCLCRAADGLPIFNSDQGNDADKMTNGHSSLAHMNGSLKHQMMMGDSSASLMPQ